MKNLLLNSYLLLTFLVWFSPLQSQDISSQYSFSRKQAADIFVSDNLHVCFKQIGTTSKVKASYLYSGNGNQKYDSMLLAKGTYWVSLILGPLLYNDDIFFCLSPGWRIIKVNKASGKFSIDPVNLIADSISVFGQVGGKFLLYKWKRHLIQLYDPINAKTHDIFDYRLLSSDQYKKYIDSDEPVGVGDIFSFESEKKILIKTGYNEAGASFDCIYYIADSFTGQVERLPFSHFEALIAEPREHLKRSPVIRLDTFSIDIDKMYFDVSDSVGYLTCRFLYEEKIDSNHSKSRTYQQDAFVVNRDFKLIGRALERSIRIAYPIYEKGKKTWNVISSQTDSSKQCFFKIKLNYVLEKAFYNIYYNTKLNQQSIRPFDKYELSLLKNFIFAKHNYGFSKPFYQGYFNTFVFYSEEERRKARIKNVDKLLTTADRSNLELLQKALK